MGNDKRGRSIAIWAFGLLSFGIFGYLIGDHLGRYGGAETYGALGGIFGFVCLRLWLGESR